MYTPSCQHELCVPILTFAMKISGWCMVRSHTATGVRPRRNPPLEDWVRDGNSGFCVAVFLAVVPRLVHIYTWNHRETELYVFFADACLVL